MDKSYKRLPYFYTLPVPTKIPKAFKSLSIYFASLSFRRMQSLLSELFSWLACRFRARAQIRA